MISESVDNRTQSRRLGHTSFVAGSVCLLLGVCGLLDSWWFGLNSERAVATVVEIDHSDETSIDTLEFTVDGRPFRVQARGALGVRWGPSRGLRSRVPILYQPDDPNNTRLASYAARFSMPLILFGIGSMFTLAGYLLLRRAQKPTSDTSGP